MLDVLESLRESLAPRYDVEREIGAGGMARDVADALAFAHAQGIIHRDIKPENILLSGAHAIVADFGIARAISAAGSLTLTQAGQPIGSPGYMSPEQAMGLGDLDARTDIYSLGCVLFEMLAGGAPRGGTKGSPGANRAAARTQTTPAWAARGGAAGVQAPD